MRTRTVEGMSKFIQYYNRNFILDDLYFKKVNRGPCISLSLKVGNTILILSYFPEK